jgi:hypothetical protein
MLFGWMYSEDIPDVLSWSTNTHSAVYQSHFPMWSALYLQSRMGERTRTTNLSNQWVPSNTFLSTITIVGNEVLTRVLRLQIMLVLMDSIYVLSQNTLWECSWELLSQYERLSCQKLLYIHTYPDLRNLRWQNFISCTTQNKDILFNTWFIYFWTGHRLAEDTSKQPYVDQRGCDSCGGRCKYDNSTS